MVKDHSASQIEFFLPTLQGLLFPVSSMGTFICFIPQTRCTSHGTLTDTRNSTNWDRSNDSSHHNGTLSHKLFMGLWCYWNYLPFDTDLNSVNQLSANGDIDFI